MVVGNLGVDPVLRYTANGVAVCNFSLATNRKQKNNDGSFKDVTMWFRIVVWRVQAENAAKYLVKGQQVFIEGTLEVEEWLDKQNVPKYTLQIQATDVQFLGGGIGKPEENSTVASSEQQPPEMSSVPVETPVAVVSTATSDDDIPF